MDTNNYIILRDYKSVSNTMNNSYDAYKFKNETKSRLSPLRSLIYNIIHADGMTLRARSHRFLRVALLSFPLF
jgi:hypothetical protein